MGHREKKNSNLGWSSRECPDPDCGEEFRLFHDYEDKQYVKHLEGHLDGAE